MYAYFSITFILLLKTSCVLLHNEDEKQIKSELILSKEWKTALEMAYQILIITIL